MQDSPSPISEGVGDRDRDGEGEEVGVFMART